MTDINELIAYQGVDGAYSHLACRHVFPEKTPVACHTFVEAMEMVNDNKAGQAMIPLENSTAGRVDEIYRLIPETSLHIVGEHFEPVNHCLLCLQDAELEDIEHVSSHPQALAQCFHNIQKIGLIQEDEVDTAGAAKNVKESGRKSHAAIASKLAADIYDLKILKENFQDRKGNTTRFLILTNSQQIPEYNVDKTYITSLIFRVRNIPAALYKSLGGFATNGINLVKLESYMSQGNFQVSRFHVDIQAHPENEYMQLAIQELEFFAEEIRSLGTFEAHPFRLANS